MCPLHVGRRPLAAAKPGDQLSDWPPSGCPSLGLAWERVYVCNLAHLCWGQGVTMLLRYSLGVTAVTSTLSVGP